MVDEAEQIRQAQNGDRDALGQLYDANHQKIFRYIAYRVGDSAVAEDLTAEVFVVMVRKLHSYEDRGKPFIAWLYTIAGNIVKMAYRKNKRVEFNPFPEEMIDQKETPDQIIEKRLTHAKLVSLLPRLTEEQHQVILLKFIEGFTNIEIAHMIGKKEGAVKGLQHRALQALKGLLLEEVSVEAS